MPVCRLLTFWTAGRVPWCRLSPSWSTPETLNLNELAPGTHIHGPSLPCKTVSSEISWHPGSTGKSEKIGDGCIFNCFFCQRTTSGESLFFVGDGIHPVCFPDDLGQPCWVLPSPRREKWVESVEASHKLRFFVLVSKRRGRLAPPPHPPLLTESKRPRLTEWQANKYHRMRCRGKAYDFIWKASCLRRRQTNVSK